MRSSGKVVKFKGINVLLLMLLLSTNALSSPNQVGHTIYVRIGVLYMSMEFGFKVGK